MTRSQANQLMQIINGMVEGETPIEVEGHVGVEGATSTAHCNEHGVEMVSKISKKSGKPYLSHFEKRWGYMEDLLWKRMAVELWYEPRVKQ